MKNINNYVFDLDEIMKFIFQDDKDERATDSEITYLYGVDEETRQIGLQNKQIRELKGGDNSVKQNIRYDLLKYFMDIVSMKESDRNATFGEALAISTLLKNNILREMNE